MDNNYWLDKWQNGQTGFHLHKVMPLLLKHWQALQLDKNTKVLVPLAGKSLDTIWLAEQGHQVTAVELSPLAVEQFFTENQLEYQTQQIQHHTIYISGSITYICGDIFKLEPAFFNEFDACYDRAALIALDKDLRNAYISHVYNNFAYNSKTLLLTIDYSQSEMAGPPFAISSVMVDQLFQDSFNICCLDTRDILANEPKFQERGLSSMLTNVYKLIKA